MGRVVVLQGVSGAGKSTYVRRLHNEFVKTILTTRGRVCVVTVSADDFFVRDGVYKFEPSKLSEAHATCFRKFLQAVGSREADLVIVDNTNTTAMEISPYILGAQAFGYEAEIHRVKCDPTVAAARNVHNVPSGSVHAMAARIYGERLPPWWKVVEVTS